MKALCYRLGLIAVALMLLPAGAFAQTTFSQADNPHVTPSEAPSDNRGGDDVILTQSMLDAVFSTSIRCATTETGITTENSFWRLFDVPALGLDGPLTMIQADIGIGEVVYKGAEPQMATINFYAVDGPFFLDTIELIGSNQFELTEDMMGAVVEIMIEDIVVPTDVSLAFELFFPHCTDAGGCRFSAGINDGGEDAPTYISSNSCGIDNPTPIEDVGSFPPQHWVLTLYGQTGAVSSEGDPIAHDVVLGLYPNPVVGSATIEVETQSTEHVTVTVVDMLGRTVTTLHDGPATGQMNLSLNGAGLSSGTYMVHIQGETFRSTRTFTVAH